MHVLLAEWTKTKCIPLPELQDVTLFFTALGILPTASFRAVTAPPITSSILVNSPADWVEIFQPTPLTRVQQKMIQLSNGTVTDSSYFGRLLRNWAVYGQLISGSNRAQKKRCIIDALFFRISRPNHGRLEVPWRKWTQVLPHQPFTSLPWCAVWQLSNSELKPNRLEYYRVTSMFFLLQFSWG